MWPLLALSLVALAIVIERLLHFHRMEIRVGEFLQGLANLVRKRKFAEALYECAGLPGPVAKVMHTAVVYHDRARHELKEIVEESAQLEVPKLEKHLGALSTICHAAPLLGFLGTILGILQTFDHLAAHGGHATAGELAGGIYVSLLTSAAGLIVAIPTYFALRYLSSRVDHFIHDMERAGVEIVNLLAESPAPTADIITFRPAASFGRPDR